MFQFRRFPSYTYLFSIQYIDVTLCGLLHSDICGSILAYSSPQLFAVNHVLHRLPMPRHSPCALISFTICFISHEFSLFLLFCIVVFLPDLLWILPYSLFVVFVNLLLVVSSLLFYLIIQFSSFLYSSFKEHISIDILFYFCFISIGIYSFLCFLFDGPKWTRTTDLTLIRRAL